MKRARLLPFVLIAFGAAAAVAEDAFYGVLLSDLNITEGTLPPEVEEAAGTYAYRWEKTPWYAALDGEGEAYVERWSPGRFVLDTGRVGGRGVKLYFRAPQGRSITGTLFFAKPDGSGMARVRFEIPPTVSASPDEAAAAFQTAKESHYQDLLDRGIAGAAWFRHQVSVAHAAQSGDAKGTPETPNNVNWRRRRAEGLEDTYDLFTGGRALSENLALDRGLRSAKAEEGEVPISTLEGITVREFNWAPLIAGKNPEKDPLAELIPADQYVLFFPAFAAMTALLDEADAHGTPVLHALEPRAEDAMTKERYERQLCLSMSAFARLIGPVVVTSVAFTGSDPFLRTGTDVAVLFDCKEPGVVLAHVTGNQAAAVAAGASAGEGKAAASKGEIDGVAYSAATAPDDSVRSYAASIGNVVAVTNSRRQLEILIAAAQKKSPALASLPEYAFFRDRYRRGNADETALLVVSDAALRKWCGPQWRIADSRRTRAAALLAELQAEHFDALVKGAAPAGAVATDLAVPAGDEVVMTPGGVRLRQAGSLRFLRPIAENPPTTATRAEAEAYKQWRAGYQDNWRRYFDPIAARFTVRPDRLAADVTVMPIIKGSDYGQFVALTGGGAIAPESADRHAGTLMHFALAIDRESETMKQMGGFLVGMAPGIKIDPLSWLGSAVALYADADPFWDDLAKVQGDPERGKFMEKNASRVPVALHAEVSSGVKLAVFLASLRAFIDQSAPGMLAWENLTHQDQTYVKVGASAQAKAQGRGAMEDLTLYYAATPQALVVTLSEAVLKRSIERGVARGNAKASEKPADAPPPWLGRSVCLQIDRGGIDLLASFSAQSYQEALQARSWGNLAILNELKRRYPDQDPVALYERFWHARPVCPGGGRYVWNDAWKTMESTVCGHPGEPKAGPRMPAPLESVRSGNFGLTFENDGVRAAIELRRAKGN